MQERKIYFDKKTTNILKGVALIMMFAHHFFTFPSWWGNEVSYPILEVLAKYINAPLKLCVSVFCFITGYMYFFNKEKNYRYSFKKITDMLIYYWGVFLVLAILAVYFTGYKYSIVSVVKEMFAFYRPTMRFCWYVLFYCSLMLIQPIFCKILSKNIFIDSAVSFVIFPFFLRAINHFIENSEINVVLSFLSGWFPCVCAGYIFANYELFENMLERINHLFVKSTWINMVVWIFLALAVPMGRWLIPYLSVGIENMPIIHADVMAYINMDVIYTPIFIYAVVNIHKYLHCRLTDMIISNIGKYSLLMWFIHCIFFNNSKKVFRPILYLPRNPILVLIWGLTLCYVASVIFNFILKRVKNIKNQLIFS